MTSRRLAPVPVQLPPSGVFVLESHHAAGFRMSTSRHSFLEIFYVLSGSGQMEIGDASYPCHPDTMLVVPPDVPHLIRDDVRSPLSLYAICLAPSLYGQADSPTLKLDSGLVEVGPAICPVIRRLLRQILYEQMGNEPAHRLLIQGLALQLLGLVLRHTKDRSDKRPTPKDRLQQYLGQLHSSFFESTDIDQAASQLGISRRRFTQLFREHTGTTWHRYVTQLRLEHARHLLSRTDRTIAAVAFESGFEDLSNFYRVFKRKCGLPPQKWRRQHQQTAGADE